MRYFHLLGLKHMARLITSFCQTYIWLQPPIACNFQYLRNILCLHSSVLFSSVTGKISEPVQLGQPMTLSCNSNQVREKNLKFCSCRLLVLVLLLQALGLCAFKPPGGPAQMFDSSTQLDGGRIKYILRHKTQIRIFKELKRSVNELQDFVRSGWSLMEQS